MVDQARPPVLALVRDLMFLSRITTAGRSLGVNIEFFRDPQALAGRTGRLLLVDLNLAGAVEAVAAWKQVQGGRVVGFVSHVDTPTIEQARQAGLDQVMSRGGFVQKLPQILADVSPD